MLIPPYYSKRKARQALRGNWQTALLVSFFSGVLFTGFNVARTVLLPEVYPILDAAYVNAYMDALGRVPASSWAVIYTLGALALVVTPVLTLGANHYFVCRLKGEELGFGGLWSRMALFGRALLLYARIAVRVFLWSLLLIVPGVICAIRYSMAPYYLAETKDITTGQALLASRVATDELKGSYFLLELSFLVPLMACLLLETLLAAFSPVLGIVASLFLQLVISTYMSCSIASFYLTLSTRGGVKKAVEEFQERLDASGVNVDLKRSHDRWEPEGADDEADEDEGDEADEDDEGETDDGAADADAAGDPPKDPEARP